MKREDNGKIRKKYIVLIHVGKNALGFSDDEFDEIKTARIGVKSCKDMSLDQLRSLHRLMKAFGWEPTPHKSAKASGMNQPAPVVKAMQLEKISALLADGDLPWSYADGIAHRMFRVERVRWCTPEELQSVIAALAKRKFKREGTYGPVH